MRTTFIVIALALSSPPVAAAERPRTRATTAAPAGWEGFAEDVRSLPERLLARVPQDRRGEPQVQQEVARVALAAIASSAIDALGADGDHPLFLPQVNHVLNVAQPNADTTYRIARITPGGLYRIRGKRGSLRMARIAEAGLLPSTATDTPPGPNPVHDLNLLPVDQDGRFDVLAGAKRPVGYTGDWWFLRPGTDRLLLRLVADDWSREVDPTIAIERIDGPAERPRMAASELERRVRALPAAIDLLAGSYIGAVERLRTDGIVNRLRRMETSALGLPDQMYYEGAYELRDDEALIVEAPQPAQCTYRSIILTNDVYETTDWYDNHSSLNDTQAAPDADDVLRIVISAKDPGVANWLDTAGYARGSIQGRWAGCDSQPVPTVRKVAFDQVRRYLRKATRRLTSDQRRAIIRERRAALQQRPLW